MTTTDPTFPIFSRLPPELRNRVWIEALPAKDPPALFIYKQDCWAPRWVYSHEEGYIPGEDNLYLEFRHEQLEPVEVDIPLAFVNREARSIAFTWAKDQGIGILVRHNGRNPTFTRRFQRTYDAMYIPYDKWHGAIQGPLDRIFQPDLMGQLSRPGLGLTHMAIPEALLRASPSFLIGLFDWYHQVQVLYVIVGEKLDLQLGGEGVKVQQRWELDHKGAKGYVWDAESAKFNPEGDKFLGDQALYWLVDEALTMLSEEFTRVPEVKRHFEIRPVFAVRG